MEECNTEYFEQQGLCKSLGTATQNDNNDNLQKDMKIEAANTLSTCIFLLEISL